MCQAIQEMIEEGRMEGWTEGRMEGRKEGWIDCQNKIIFHMLDLQQAPEKISELTGEPLSRVYEIQEKYEQMRK